MIIYIHKSTKNVTDIFAYYWTHMLSLHTLFGQNKKYMSLRLKPYSFLYYFDQNCAKDYIVGNPFYFAMDSERDNSSSNRASFNRLQSRNAYSWSIAPAAQR